MDEIRVKCQECDNMILARAAEANNGLCGQCVGLSERQRAERRAYIESLQSGQAYSPSAKELASAVSFTAVEPEPGQWALHPEYYANEPDQTIASTLDRAVLAPNGNVVLNSASGGTLILAFNSTYGACEYRNDTTDTLLLAHSSENASSQVPEDLQLCQICACCGVGLLWYPSRFHMPRHRAFECVDALIRGTVVDDVRWLDADEISFTQPGRG
jgi:hypothetical protein